MVKLINKEYSQRKCNTCIENPPNADLTQEDNSTFTYFINCFHVDLRPTDNAKRCYQRKNMDKLNSKSRLVFQISIEVKQIQTSIYLLS